MEEKHQQIYFFVDESSMKMDMAQVASKLQY